MGSDWKYPPFKIAGGQFKIANRQGGGMEIKVKDFESALKSLEDIVVQLESGDLTLDRALELFEEGIRVSRFCSSKLEEAERKVEVLVKSASGDMKEEPFAENVDANET